MLAVNCRFLTQELTGVQRFATEITKHLYSLTKRIDFLSPVEVPKNQLPIPTKKIGFLKGHLWEQIELPIYLRKRKDPLLLNLTNTAPFFYENQIVTIHDVAFLKHPEWYSKKFHLFYSKIVPIIAKKSKKIITVSNFSKKEIISLLRIPENKIEVIYNGVDKKFQPSKIKKENLILTVSSLNPRKNLKNLILAFRNLKLKEDFKLVIVGSKNRIYPDAETIEKLIKPYDNIKIISRVPDEMLVKLYQKAKLFVYIPFYEGFGLPPLEAMACGTPVVVSQTSSLPEVCGDAAYYVNPYEVRDIVHGIEKVLKDEKLQRYLIAKGLKRAKLFNWKDSASKLLEITKEVQS